MDQDSRARRVVARHVAVSKYIVQFPAVVEERAVGRDLVERELPRQQLHERVVGRRRWVN